MPTFIAHDLILKHWVINVKLSTFLTNFQFTRVHATKEGISQIQKNVMLIN